MKEKIYNVLVGIILCVYAITTLAFLIFLPKYNLLFKGWWTFLIIFPSLGNLLFQKNKVSSAYILLTGILLLLTNQGIMPFIKCFTILVCLGIIIIGISIIKTTLNLTKNKKDTKKNTTIILYNIWFYRRNRISYFKRWWRSNCNMWINKYKYERFNISK